MRCCEHVTFLFELTFEFSGEMQVGRDGTSRYEDKSQHDCWNNGWYRGIFRPI